MRATGAQPSASKPRIQSLARADAILSAVAGAPDGICRLQDLSRALALNRTTVFNLAESLVILGFLRKDPRSSSYSLGLRNVELGRAVTRGRDLLTLCRPALVRICHQTGETVNLAVPHLSSALIIESYEGRHGVRATAYAGTRSAYHSSACGKALLVRLAPEVRRQIYQIAGLTRLTERTITEVAALERDLELVERRGYAVEIEENEIGAFCVATALSNPFGEPLAAISIAGVTQRRQADTIARFAGLLKDEIPRLEARLAGALDGDR
jgi:DNA-binding IclR family transcriptional regulator